MRSAVVVVVAAIAATVGLIILVGHRAAPPAPPPGVTTTLAGRGAAEQRAATAWERAVADIVAPLVADAPQLLRGAEEWSKGARPTERFQTELAGHLQVLVSVRDNLSHLEPFNRAPAASRRYVNSTQLYIEVARLYSVVTTMAPDDLRTQVELLARRVRVMADRVYDRGRAGIAPFRHEPVSTSTTLRPAEPAPVWADEHLAAGPPLDDSPAVETPAPAGTPGGSRAGARREEPLDVWRRAVEAADIPPAPRLADAIDAADAVGLAELARRFIAAGERLRARPDPAGGHEKSAVLRLGLLLDAEAARAGRAAALAGPSDDEGGRRLADVARRLALVGQELWPAELGRRQSHLDPALLSNSSP